MHSTSEKRINQMVSFFAPTNCFVAVIFSKFTRSRRSAKTRQSLHGFVSVYLWEFCPLVWGFLPDFALRKSWFSTDANLLFSLGIRWYWRKKGWNRQKRCLLCPKTMLPSQKNLIWFLKKALLLFEKTKLGSWKEVLEFSWRHFSLTTNSVFVFHEDVPHSSLWMKTLFTITQKPFHWKHSASTLRE